LTLDELAAFVCVLLYALFTCPYPLEKRVIDEYLAVVGDECDILCKGLEAGDHAFFEQALKSNRIHELLKTFG
jgi:hypothetical protein